MSAAADPECDRLDIEKPAEGLYLHRATANMPDGVKVTSVRDPDGTERHLVDAEQFMAVQRDRDDYRRALALINAWRLTPGRDETQLVAQLARAGFTDGDGEAMRELVAQVRSGQLRTASTA